MACRLTPTSSATWLWDNPLDCLICFNRQMSFSRVFLMDASAHESGQDIKRSPADVVYQNILTFINVKCSLRKHFVFYK
jgi:hypothetical protein